MQFVWFWTFWHWSKESFRGGAVLRDPLEGIGGHWDEWYRHEASAEDQRAIEALGRNESGQREFIAWLFLHWAREGGWQKNRLVPRFVLGQLARLPPFDQWSAFAEYREGYGVGGLSAIVLAGGSPGESTDVRPVEAMLLPGVSATTTAEGFQAQASEVEVPRQTAVSLLRGKGLLAFLALWIAGGRRPYPRWLTIALRAGWATVAGIIVYLFWGPDVGHRIELLVLTLAALWSGLVATAVSVVVTQCFCAWRAGKKWRKRLDENQLRVRMEGGLVLKGASAGLPFCLNTLLGLYRMFPPAAAVSWLWRTVFHSLHSNASSWAATGVVTPGGRIQPVVLDPKIRACLQHSEIKHIITPRQREARPERVCRVAEALTPAQRRTNGRDALVPMARLGFAAEKACLRTHQCRHVGQALMAIGGLFSRSQAGVNVAAVLLSAVMLLAFTDMRALLLPPAAPAVVPPASPSPYSLWVSIQTDYPQYFSVVLESDYWSNRRSDVTQRGGATPSVRGELLLHRLTGAAANEENGSVWIERRRRFLTREFHPGERVGQYSIAYISHLGYE